MSEGLNSRDSLEDPSVQEQHIYGLEAKEIAFSYERIVQLVAPL
jgi:hypothetical protein